MDRIRDVEPRERRGVIRMVRRGGPVAGVHPTVAGSPLHLR